MCAPSSGAVRLLSAPTSSPSFLKRACRAATLAASFLLIESAWANPTEAMMPQGQNAVETVAAAVRVTGARCDEPRELEYDAEASRPDRPAWTIRCEQGLFRVTFEGDTGPKVTPLNQ